MTKRVTILWIISFITAVILMDLMKIYEETSKVIIDNILFVLCVLFVGGWILDKLFGIFINILPESKPVKNKKIKKKIKKSDEITLFQFIIFYPIATFSCMILIGLVTSGFKP